MSVDHSCLADLVAAKKLTTDLLSLSAPRKKDPKDVQIKMLIMVSAEAIEYERRASCTRYMFIGTRKSVSVSGNRLTAIQLQARTLHRTQS